jgi:magnesium chelatase subunit H
VFESLWRTLEALKSDGYRVDLPASVDALRQRVLEGNASRYGTAANVHARIPADEHVRREPWLAEIEAQWGPAPGKHNSDGSAIQILGERFGNVFVGIQPAFGFEGDPMRLLFEKGFAPTHAFSAFYRWMREDFDAHAVLHFGTHGALEFMPGKQAGLSAKCWPERLIGDLPNIYLYAANNPSEGTLAKRRSAATLVSYLTPPVTTAGLYRGLLELNASLQEWRQLTNEARAARLDLLALIQAQAAAVELAEAAPAWSPDDDSPIRKLTTAVLELEYTLIPHGLHVVGEPATEAERIDLLAAMADSSDGPSPTRPEIEAIVAATHRGEPASAKYPPDSVLARLSEANDLLARDTELHGLLHALDGRFVRPAPGGDLIRTPAILPTGRNIHGFDPFRIPSKIAILEGRQQAQCLLARHVADGNPAPEAVALVLWGTDNLKSGGGPIAQALALIGAEPRFDSYGRLAGATLIPLEQLGRPRIDVVVTLSGIFRDLLPLQIKLLAEAAYLAASADEPETLNFVRKHVLRYQAEHHCDLETASLRVFGNAEGAYGSNINHLVENGRWECADEIAEMYERRKGFAYGRQGRPSAQPKLLADVLAGVDLTYQNLESVELGVTTIDTYFDTLGGITGAVRRARGAAPPVYIGDQTRGENRVRTLGEQIALETRTRVVNPKWYEGMIRHGYEGVRQIEAHVTNTVGWSATTGHVTPWVYQSISQTFVLDKEMRDRLAALNPTSSVKLAQRLIEAHQRQFWSPDDATLAALRDAADELEDRLEGLTAQEAAA